MNKSENKFSEFLDIYDQIFTLLNKEENSEKYLAILRRYFRYILNTPSGEGEINFGGITERNVKLINSQVFLWKIREILNYRVLDRSELNTFNVKTHKILDELSLTTYEILGEFLQELIGIIEQSSVIKFDGYSLVPLRKNRRAKFEYLRNVVLCTLFMVSRYWMIRVSENDSQIILYRIAALRAITNVEFNLLLDSKDIKPVFALAGKKSYSARSEELPEKSILVMTLTNEYLAHCVLEENFSPISFNDLVFDIGMVILDIYKKLMRGKNKAHCYFLESHGKIYKDFHKLVIKEIEGRLNEERSEVRKSGEDGFYWGKYKVVSANSDESIGDLFKTYHIVIKDGELHYNRINFDLLDQKSFIKKEDFIKNEEEKLTSFLSNVGYKDINCIDPLKIAKFLDENVRKFAAHSYWMFPVLAHRVYSCSETYCEVSRQIYSFTKNLKWKLKENHEKWRSNVFKTIIESNYAKLNSLLNKNIS